MSKTPQTLIDELRKLLVKSTPGPWRWRVGPGEKLQVVSGGNPPSAGVADLGYDLGEDWPATNNAALIATTINALPAMLDDLEAALRAELAEAYVNDERERAQYIATNAALRAELARKTEALEKECSHHVAECACRLCTALAEPKAGGEPPHISEERIVGVVDELGPLVRMGKPTR